MIKFMFYLLNILIVIIMLFINIYCNIQKHLTSQIKLSSFSSNQMFLQEVMFAMVSTIII